MSRACNCASVVLAVLITVLSGSVTAHAGSVNLFSNNVVVTNSMTSANDIAGQSVVNNLTASGSNSYFGMNLSSGDALDASGGVSGSFRVNSGVFHHNGSITGALVNYNNGATNATDTVASTLLSQLSSQISSDSAGFAAMSTTPGTSANINNQVLDFVYSGAHASEVIFNIPGSELSTLNGIQFNLGNASNAVINVKGAGNYSVGSAFNFQGLSSSIYTSVLWNFNSAASFTTSNEWAGSVLGPNLTFKSGQDVDGSIYVSNFVQGGNSEVHSDLFGGPLPPAPPGAPTAVPLPKPIFLGLGLFAVLAAARWGKSRQAVVF